MPLKYMGVMRNRTELMEFFRSNPEMMKRSGQAFMRQYYPHYTRGKIIRRGIHKRVLELVQKDKRFAAEMQQNWNQYVKEVLDQRKKEELARKEAIDLTTWTLTWSDWLEKYIDHRSVDRSMTKKKSQKIKRSSKPKKIVEFFKVTKGYIKKCPRKGCNKVARTKDKIKELFGFRNMNGIERPQSLCRVHRH